MGNMEGWDRLFKAAGIESEVHDVLKAVVLERPEGMGPEMFTSLLYRFEQLIARKRAATIEDVLIRIEDALGEKEFFVIREILKGM